MPDHHTAELVDMDMMASSDQLLVLNVDDDEAGRYASTRVLRHAGFQVVEASTGPEALELARRLPDVILLDVGLPGMSGFDVCRTLKADPLLAMIPVIYLSATSQDTLSMVEGYDAGGDAYLTEPVDPLVLQAAIRASVRARRARQASSVIEQRLGRVLESVTDPLCILDQAGVITQCSEAFARLTSSRRRDLVGKSIGRVLPVDDLGTVLEAGEGASTRCRLSIQNEPWDLVVKPVGPVGNPRELLALLGPAPSAEENA